MKREISDKISTLLKKQGFVIVSTLDRKGSIHCSAKGVIDVKKEGEVYLIDLYKRLTYSNLQRTPVVSITVIDEEDFIGFTLKGEASIVKRDKMQDKSVQQWEKKVIERISKRVVKNIKKDKSSSKLPEAKFPQPEYLIKMEVFQIIDLAPTHLKKSVFKGKNDL